MPKKKIATDISGEPISEGAAASNHLQDEAAVNLPEEKASSDGLSLETMPEILDVSLDESADLEESIDDTEASSESIALYGEAPGHVSVNHDATAAKTDNDISSPKTPKARVSQKRTSSVKTDPAPANNVPEKAHEQIDERQDERDDRRAFFDLDFNELDRDLTPEQKQEWNSIYASYRGHSVMTGTIVGIDRHRVRIRDRRTGEIVWHRLYCAIVIPFRVRILIPETEMWAEGDNRPGFVLRNIPGATIDFVIIHVDREAGFAVGSRRRALPSRRYFFSTQPGLNTPGSRVNCEVLVVGPRRCLVSCHGYDLNLSQRELSYTAIPDLRDVYHSGMTLDCIVKTHDRKHDLISVSVKETAPNPYDGAEFRHPVQSHRQAVIAGKYGGGVFCNMADGVTVMCSYSFHYDDSAFRIGDRVMLIIQKYDDNKKQIYGKIVAKC